MMFITWQSRFKSCVHNFSRQIFEGRCKGDTTMTIDINEKNATYSVLDLHGNVIKTVRLDIYKAKRIHDNYPKERKPGGSSPRSR